MNTRIALVVPLLATSLLALAPCGALAERSKPGLAKWTQTSPSQSGVFETWIAASAPLAEPPLALEGREKSAGEDADFQTALFGGGSEGVGERLATFVKKYPDSRWTPSAELNLGGYAYRKGYFTRAIAYFESAYRATKASEGKNARRLAGASAAQLAGIYSRLGRMEDLGPLLDDALAAEPDGSARQMLEHSRDAFTLMNVEPGVSFRCGTLALARIREAQGLAPMMHPVLVEAQSTWRGFALAEVEQFAQQMGMDFVAVKAPAGWAELPVPCVVHWKQNHYAAIVSRSGDGKYLVRDLTFGLDAEISAEALAEEASGYFVVERKSIPAGWTTVGETEAWQVFGRGVTTGSDGNGTGPDDRHEPDCGPPANPAPGGGRSGAHGMARHSFHTMLASLHIEDIPIGYQPPVGPEICFLLHYNQRETVQPSTSINYSYVGRQWGHNWSTWIEMPSTLKAKVVLSGGGAEEYTRASGTSAFVTPDPRSFAKLTMTGSNAFRRDLSDGSKQIFSTAQSLGGGAYRVFLTEFTDRFGNTVELSYDGSFRLITITDAIGQETTLEYADPNDSYLITKITDPFEREAVLAYNSSGQLTSITDVQGIVSSFTYGTGNFVNSLTTPYGTTTFANTVAGTQRILTATDPLGGTEKLEFNFDLGGTLSYPGDQTVPSSVVVGSGTVSFGTFNSYVQARNSFYWDKKQFAEGSGDRANATQYHWLHMPDTVTTSRSLESMKRPLESWVFFNYPNQSNYAFEASPFVATPSKTARVINNVSGTKTVALAQTEVNAAGNPTKIVDPLGRETVMSYAANGIDLIEVKQKNAGGTYDTLFTGTYNGQHLPLSVTGADGKTTSYIWNGQGQLTSVTNALSGTTSYTYDGDGYLQSIDPPLSGTADQITLMYDGFGRVETRSQWGYTLSYEYDNLDRITKVTYPDGKTEEMVYEAMHARWLKDKLGRWTRQDVNAIQEIVGVLNSAAEYTTFEWCKCGSLAAIIDAQGHATRWGLDLQGRQTSKIYADGRADTYAYNAYSGWLETMTDAAGQQVKTEYAPDGRVMATRYLNETIGTPDVTLTWDAKYPRVTSMVDGTGTTSYTYRASGATGAGGIATVDGPLGNDTITLDYDDLSRVVSRMIDATGESVTYDALGRVATVTNPLDVFTVAYSGTTGLPLTVTGSKGLSVTNSYYNVAEDYQVQETTYTWSGTQTLAEFGYQYDVGGRISQWDHQVGGGDPRRVVPSYDAGSRLIGAVTTNPSTSALVTAEANRYDRVGNRQGHQEGSAVTTGAFNVVNQLLSLASGGEAVLQGSLNEPGSVTAGGRSTQTDGNNKFRLAVPVTTGSNQLTMVSEDVNGNSTTNTAAFSVANSGTTAFSYDLNGNTTNDGQRTYSWDGDNRLVKITYSGSNNYTEFTYDGAGRRVRIKEIESGTTASDKRFVWNGLSIAELRAADGTTVQRRFYGSGFQFSGTSGTEEYFYVRDHLGSIRGLMDKSGVERGRWSYELCGTRSSNQITSSPVETDFGYTGHYFQERSGLIAAPFRFYNSSVSRWLSRDPLGEFGGLNLYQYAASDPINVVDPSGEHPIIIGAIVIGLMLVTSPDVANAPAPGDPTYSSSGMADMVIGGAVALPVSSLLGKLIGAVGSRICAPKPPLTGPLRGPCFAEGTEISTPNGHKAIEQIKEGDIVLAYDFTNSQVVQKEVTKLNRGKTYSWIHVAVDTGDEIKATRFHPFWVENRNAWVEAMDLEPGMLLRMKSGQSACVVEVSAELLAIPEVTFNFEVADVHTYFVASGLLVHNGGSPSPEQLLGLEFANKGAFESAQTFQLEGAKAGRAALQAEGLWGNGFRLDIPTQMQDLAHPGNQPHIHGVDGTGKPWSLNINGTLHDAKSSTGTISNEVKAALRGAGWGC